MSTRSRDTPDRIRKKVRRGGIIEKEVALHVSNVAVFNAVSGKGDRIGIKRLQDGRKVRIFKSTGEVVDV